MFSSIYQKTQTSIKEYKIRSLLFYVNLPMLVFVCLQKFKSVSQSIFKGFSISMFCFCCLFVLVTARKKNVVKRAIKRQYGQTTWNKHFLWLKCIYLFVHNLLFLTHFDSTVVKYFGCFLHIILTIFTDMDLHRKLKS